MLLFLVLVRCFFFVLYVFVYVVVVLFGIVLVRYVLLNVLVVREFDSVDHSVKFQVHSSLFSYFLALIVGISVDMFFSTTFL